ncbi:hypothetical protein H5U35_03100, partial [Candidatus Aerophobetes bacterium]|nr:hypothetical protein [Candidatus Aerophobetes bacterium]
MMTQEVLKKVKERKELIDEFQTLLKDFQEAKIRLRKKPGDYNEPHYLIYESEELHPVAEMFANISPGDDGSVKIYMLGSPLEQKIVRYLEENVKDEKIKKNLINCVKRNIPRPEEE